MSLLRLHSPAIVLLLWAAVWAAGVHGDAMIVLGLALTGVTVIVHTVEEAHRRHRGN